MPPVLSKPSLEKSEKWQKYERCSMAKQQEFVERYKDDFDKVPVTNSDNIKVGDHLVLEKNILIIIRCVPQPEEITR